VDAIMVKEQPFIIEEETVSGIPIITVRNKRTNEYYSIIPQSGGRLRELWLNNGKKNISVLRKIENIHSQNPDDIFTNAKLSPFAGRIQDGRYVVDNVKYNLELNYLEEKNASHGFVYNKAFMVVAKDVSEDQATCRLQYQYDGHVKGYPFSYTLEVSYSLTLRKGFVCTTKIINRSESVIPLSDGWHHYFDLGSPVDELKLKLNVSHMIELDARKIPTGHKIPFIDYAVPLKIGDRIFDSCFRVNGDNGKAVTELISENRDINLSLWQEIGKNKFNYLVIYTPSDRKTIAIEPMTSNVNSFNTGEGLMLLSPNDEYISSFGIFLKK
jgi:aldose 1-epimerase